MRVLELDGEPERIDEIVDAQIEARAMEQRLIDAIAGSSDIVVAIFIAETIIETDVEPLELVKRSPRTRPSGTHILGRIRITLGTVTLRLPREGRRLGSRPRHAEAEQSS
jgi:hypothetical protein